MTVHMHTYTPIKVNDCLSKIKKQGLCLRNIANLHAGEERLVKAKTMWFWSNGKELIYGTVFCVAMLLRF